MILRPQPDQTSPQQQIRAEIERATHLVVDERSPGRFGIVLVLPSAIALRVVGRVAEALHQGDEPLSRFAHIPRDVKTADQEEPL